MMKFTIVCLGLALCCALVCGESCRDVSDCNFENCVGDGWAPSCHFGQCTCENGVHTGSSCTVGSDCTGTNCPNILRPHCVDSKCRCTFGTGGIGK